MTKPRISESRMSRRRMLGCTVAAAGFPMINIGHFPVHAMSPKRYSRRAVDLIRKSLVIDMLGVINIDPRPHIYGEPVGDRAAGEFRSSGITGFHHSGAEATYDGTVAYFAKWGGFVGRNADLFTLVDKADDLDRAKRDGKCAIIMGVQNSNHFRTPADVQFFYELGQRCSQLTYNSQNLLGSGSTERVDGGLSDFGVAIIGAMNKVGMLVDVSHCGDRTTLDAIDASPKAIAITHSNCRAINDHPRLKTDEAIRALAAKGGVMGIAGVRNFVTAQEPTNISHIADHIDHVARLVGIEHVGVGSDADLNGYDDLPEDIRSMLRTGYKDSYAFRDKFDTDGFDHPMKMYDLAEELIRRNYSDADISAVLGGNFRRLLGATWL